VDLQKRLVANLDAKWNMTNGVDNAGVLSTLPSQMRGTIAFAMHADTILNTSPLFESITSECAKTILARMRPQVCLMKELLISKGGMCQSLFILLRGALQCQTTAPSNDRRSGDNDMPAKGGGKNASKSTGIERQGAIMGFVDPFSRHAGRFPFFVMATKLTHLLTLTRGEVADIMGAFKGEDADSLQEVLEKEHRTIIDALKITDTPLSPLALFETDRANREGPTTGKLREIREQIGKVEEELAGCIEGISAVRTDMDALPKIFDLVQKHAGFAALPKASALPETATSA